MSPYRLTSSLLAATHGLVRQLNFPQRTGDKRELLKGPLTYGIVHVAATLLFWRSSPVGCTTITILCAYPCVLRHAHSDPACMYSCSGLCVGYKLMADLQIRVSHVCTAWWFMS